MIELAVKKDDLSPELPRTSGVDAPLLVPPPFCRSSRGTRSGPPVAAAEHTFPATSQHHIAACCPGASWGTADVLLPEGFSSLPKSGVRFVRESWVRFARESQVRWTRAAALVSQAIVAACSAATEMLHGRTRTLAWPYDGKTTLQCAQAGLIRRDVHNLTTIPNDIHKLYTPRTAPKLRHDRTVIELPESVGQSRRRQVPLQSKCKMRQRRGGAAPCPARRRRRRSRRWSRRRRRRRCAGRASRCPPSPCSGEGASTPPGRASPLVSGPPAPHRGAAQCISGAMRSSSAGRCAVHQQGDAQCISGATSSASAGCRAVHQWGASQ